MIRSLLQNCHSATVFVLCMDDYTYRLIHEHFNNQIIPIALSEVETDEVLVAKKTRSVAEYCWTLSSVFTWFVIDNYKDVDLITYLDADIYFYSNIEPIFDEIGDSSIAIIEHRFSPRLADRIVNGRFCVEWCSFRRDNEGLACLNLWREKCLEWCYYRLEDGKMGDQKYLDSWPIDFKSCHIIQHLGAGVAPWNYSQYVFSTTSSDSSILVDGIPLIFYHFHQFQLLGPKSSSRLSDFYRRECIEPQSVYKLYETHLYSLIREFQELDSSFNFGISRNTLVFRARRFAQKHLPNRVKDLYRSLLSKLRK